MIQLSIDDILEFPGICWLLAAEDLLRQASPMALRFMKSFTMDNIL
jgi:hypothetical protein